MGLSKKFKKNLGRTGLGIATGGISEAVNALKPKKQNMEQTPLETPEQAQARQKLLDFANTGTIGNFTAGADVGLGYGDYGITDTEKMGQSAIQGLLNLDPSYTDPFKAQVQRQIQDSNTELKRNAGFAGNLYSTNTIRNLGNIETRGNESLMSHLADMRIQGIGLSQQYGGLTRQLNDASIKARDAEILRRRQELQMPLETYGTIIGTPVQYGVRNIPYQQPSPYMDLLNTAASLYGSYKGGK